MNNKFKLASIFLALTGCIAAPQGPSVDLKNLTILVEVYQGDQLTGSGSGILVAKGEEYVVLTAKHVIDAVLQHPQHLNIKVTTHLETALEVTNIIPSETHDAALLMFKSKQNYSITKISNKLPEPMSKVYASGYPLSFFLSISEGLINYSIAKTIKDIWTCTAPIYPGSSGGGVYDVETKELIGMSVMIGSHSVPIIGKLVVPHMHMFIPIVHLKDLLGNIK